MFYFYFIININVVGLQHYNLQPLLWIQLFISMQIRIRSQTNAYTDPDLDPGHKKSNFFVKYTYEGETEWQEARVIR